MKYIRYSKVSWFQRMYAGFRVFPPLTKIERMRLKWVERDYRLSRPGFPAPEAKIEPSVEREKYR